MKSSVKLACMRELHPECFYWIENSSSRESLKVGCEECRKKYQSIVKESLKGLPIKPKSQVRATKGWLLERVILLERKNALLEKEIGELKKGGSD